MATSIQMDPRKMLVAAVLKFFIITLWLVYSKVHFILTSHPEAINDLAYLSTMPEKGTNYKTLYLPTTFTENAPSNFFIWARCTFL
jgi:hypothetical protein